MPVSSGLLGLALAVLALRASRETEASGHATLLTKVTSACSETRFLMAVRQHFSGKLAAAQQSAKDLANDLALIDLVKAKTPKGDGHRKLSALAALAPTTLQSAVSELTSKTGEWQKTLEMIDRRRGQLAALKQIDLFKAPTHSGTATAGTSGTFGGGNSNGACIVKFAASTVDKQACDAETTGSAELDEAATHLDDFETLTLVHDDNFKRPELAVKAVCKGTVSSAGASTSESACGTTTTSNNENNAVGVESVTPSKPSTTTDKQARYTKAGQGRTCEPTTGKDTALTVTAGLLAAQLCHGNAQKAQNEKPVSTEKVNDLANDAAMQAIVIALNPEKYSPDKAVSDTLKAVKDFLGESTETVEVVFLKAAADQTQQYKIAGEETSETLAALAKKPSAGPTEAVLYAKYQGAVNCRKPFEEAITAKPKCSEKIKKEECNDPCKWAGTDKNGKCKTKGEKEEVQVENDAKTTNTTGNNSFVINKAPLLLAVLLF
uniref:Variant surface glycoprotein 529 n=1 Tax=Trypanosoma brucei TaxID=5691 RepID=M4T1X3_9TRYP|nr:variant surface glycoprotein 529 [Trypanosoma brucei]